MMQFDAPSCIFRSRRALVADRGCAGRPVRVLPITEDHTTPLQEQKSERQDRDRMGCTPHDPARDRHCDVQRAPSDLKLLLQAQEFKRIAWRADKTDQSFEAMIYLAATIINSR